LSIYTKEGKCGTLLFFGIQAKAPLCGAFAILNMALCAVLKI